MNLKWKKLLPIITIIILIIGWETIVRITKIPSYILPSPSMILKALFTEFPALLDHSLVTLFEAVLGMGIAILLGILLGIGMDMFPLFRACVYPLLIVSQTIPAIILAPIFMIYLGFGLAPKIITVILMCFFPIVINFSDGMSSIDPEYINLVQSFGANRRQVYQMVKFPAAFTSLLSGLRVAASYSITGAVVGEWMGAQKGLGYYMIKAKNGYMLDKVFACVVVIVCLSLLMNGLTRLLQYYAMPYEKKGRKEET